MMALRHRLTLLAAATVGVTVVLVAIVAYVVLRSELRGQVDQALETQYAQVLRAVRGEGIARALGIDLPGAVAARGRPERARCSSSRPAEPSSPARRAPTSPCRSTRPTGRSPTASAGRWSCATSAAPTACTCACSRWRSATAARSRSRAASPTSTRRSDACSSCSSCCAPAATLLAAFFGRLFGRQVIQPVSELTAAAEHITQTDDLGRRIEVRSDDEVGQMAQRFNAMLDALERSRRALDDSVHSQRQLVADASHELRTPVTSLRTNIEVLLSEGGELPADDRTRLLEDVRAETEELTALITDVIELARGDEPLQGVDDVQFDALVAEAVARARRRRPRTTFNAELEPTVVEGLSERLGRAVDNLLDNAAKHAPEDTVVDVVLRGGELTVRDRGPGIPAAERAHVFDRFYRGADARGRPGSGLGPGDRAPGRRDARRLDRRRGGAGRRRAVPAAPGARRRRPRRARGRRPRSAGADHRVFGRAGGGARRRRRRGRRRRRSLTMPPPLAAADWTSR